MANKNAQRQHVHMESRASKKRATTLSHNNNNVDTLEYNPQQMELPFEQKFIVGQLPKKTQTFER